MKQKSCRATEAGMSDDDGSRVSMCCFLRRVQQRLGLMMAHWAGNGAARSPSQSHTHLCAIFAVFHRPNALISSPLTYPQLAKHPLTLTHTHTEVAFGRHGSLNAVEHATLFSSVLRLSPLLLIPPLVSALTSVKDDSDGTHTAKLSLSKLSD